MKYAKTWRDNPQPQMRGTRIEPAQSLLQGRPYIPSHSTDIRETFARVRQGLRTKLELAKART